MSTTVIDPKTNNPEEENRMKEEVDMQNGPFKLIMSAIKNRQRIMISMRNNKKLLAIPKAVDRHCNLVLENVTEMYIEHVNNEPLKREKFISKLFVRGDSVVIIVDVHTESPDAADAEN
eukprot:NODE_132_length_18298_cov_0.443101.p12 type:complete len:119 gc:universal NODE_132_length_18298_cov_0.443101:2991-2635(-)